MKRPRLCFIATLPTLGLPETKYKDRLLWKVDLPKPVVILYDNYPVLNTFWIEIMQSGPWNNYGGLEIGIKKTKMGNTYIIPPHNEDFYLKVKWWNWEK